MSVCAHVGVDAERHSCRFPFFGSEHVDDVEFGEAFHVEAEDVGIESEIYFPVALAHACIYDAFGLESRLYGGLYLTSADAVGSESSFSYYAEQLLVSVSLNGIVNAVSFVFCGFFRYGAQCAAQ